MKTDLKILPAGDSAVVAEFGNTIDPLINDQVQAMTARIHSAGLAGIRELIPSFRSLLILYDPRLLSYQKLTETLKQFSFSLSASGQKEKRIHLIPCCYGSHFGPDLSDMEKTTGLSREEIIAIHSGIDYRIYMLGFLPGFVYLGGLDKRIEMPRLSTPRVKIPQGAVGIGGSQTGVYPLDSPGGWRLIGGTPVDFYDPNRPEPILCKAGEYIRFVPISSCEYYDIRQQQAKGLYQPKIRVKKEAV